MLEARAVIMYLLPGSSPVRVNKLVTNPSPSEQPTEVSLWHSTKNPVTTESEETVAEIVMEVEVVSVLQLSIGADGTVEVDNIIVGVAITVETIDLPKPTFPATTGEPSRPCSDLVMICTV